MNSDLRFFFSLPVATIPFTGGGTATGSGVISIFFSSLATLVIASTICTCLAPFLLFLITSFSGCFFDFSFGISCLDMIFSFDTSCFVIGFSFDASCFAIIFSFGISCFEDFSFATSCFDIIFSFSGTSCFETNFSFATSCFEVVSSFYYLLQESIIILSYNMFVESE